MEAAYTRKNIHFVYFSEAPWFDKTVLQDMVVKAGQKINYTIPIEASPRPKANWSVNGKPVEPGVRADIQTFANQTVFEILFSVRNDTGRYTLTLENELGQCSASANVTVLGKCSFKTCMNG
jgi:hypothetical protein